jgi:outer membrane receptor protein involved in Fe transport
LAAGGSSQIGDGALTVLAQYKTYDGPWELPESLDHKAVWLKYCADASEPGLCASLSGYKASWRPTEQIPEAVIGRSVCEDEYCSLEDSSVGETERLIATLSGENDIWKWTTYLQYYDWRMSSNPTYDEQIFQFDERVTAGGNINRFYNVNNVLDASIGGDFRYDRISEVGVDFFKDGHFLASNGHNEIKQTSSAVYADLKWQAAQRLRVNLGLRADYYHFDVSALNVLSAQGKESDNIVSPKLGLAYRFGEHVEAYANWGYGFHSNDARGVVNKEKQVEGLVRGEGYESGVRFQKGGLTFSAVYWALNIDSELIFVGDSNSVEPKGGSKRSGVELVGFWSPSRHLAFDATLGLNRARFTEPELAGGKYVDGAVETAGQFGITLNHNQWDVSARLRYLGKYALVPDNSERANSTKTISLRAAYHFDKVSLYGEVVNLTNERGKDIVYYYETNVSGFGESEGRVSRAKEPRTLRVGVRYNF